MCVCINMSWFGIVTTNVCVFKYVLIRHSDCQCRCVFISMSWFGVVTTNVCVFKYVLIRYSDCQCRCVFKYVLIRHSDCQCMCVFKYVLVRHRDCQCIPRECLNVWSARHTDNHQIISRISINWVHVLCECLWLLANSSRLWKYKYFSFLDLSSVHVLYVCCRNITH